MKYWMIAGCFLLLGFVVGCGSSEPSNIINDADQTALDEYEAALAEADKLAEGDKDFEE